MRLIDADRIDFNEVFKGASDFAKDTREAAQSLIDKQPTIEAAPVVHGVWENGCSCSKCGQVDWSKPNFCPNCGADMRTTKN